MLERMGAQWVTGSMIHLLFPKPVVVLPLGSQLLRIFSKARHYKTIHLGKKEII